MAAPPVPEIPQLTRAIGLPQAAAIVIVVIFLFLGSLRSTLIPIVTIPLSLIGVMFALLTWSLHR